MPINQGVSWNGFVSVEAGVIRSQVEYLADFSEDLEYRGPTSLFSRPRKPTLQQRRAREEKSVAAFITCGSSNQDKYVDDTGKLTVLGYEMGDTNILFTLDEEVIIAQMKRTKHLKPLLTELAEREGLELRLIETPPETVFGREIMYYSFKNRTQADDTALVTSAMPRSIPNSPDTEVTERWTEGHVLEDVPF